MKRGKTILLSVLLITIILFSSKLIFSQAGGGDLQYNPQCDDGIDNDGDGYIDLGTPGSPPDDADDGYNWGDPPDPGCEDSQDDDETDPECNDGIDNDGDGKIDYCFGPSSYCDPECSELHDNTEGPITQCNDDIDNDGDGKIDYPKDPGCAGRYNDTTEISFGLVCDNNIDETNDADTLKDYRLSNKDPGCSNLLDTNEQDGQCDDKIDNDGDGKIDYGTTTTNDPGCTSYSDNDETNAPSYPSPQCSDGADNDVDSLIDMTDSGCSSGIDNDETNAPSSGPLDESCVPQSGLVSWWRADGNTEDSEDGNEGIASLGVTYDQGKYGQAFELDYGDNIKVTNNPNLNPVKELTLTAWIKPAATLSTYSKNIINKYGSYGGPGGYIMNLPLSSGVTSLQGVVYYNPSPGCSQCAYIPDNIVTQYPSLNEWHHVAFVVNPIELKLYIDGNLAKSEPRSSLNDLHTSISDLYLGSAAPSFGESKPLYGLLDEVLVYNRALTDLEITDLVNCVPIIPPTQCTFNSDCQPGQVCLNGNCVDDGGTTNGDCGLGYGCVAENSACFNDDTNIFKRCDPAYYCTDDSTSATCANPKKVPGATCSNNYECLSDNCEDDDSDSSTPKICVSNQGLSCSDVDGIVCDPGETCDPGDWNELDVSELRCCVGNSDPESPKCKGGDQWIPTLGTSVRFDKQCIGSQTQVTVVDTFDNLPLSFSDTDEAAYLNNLGVTTNPYIDSQDHSCNTDLFQSSTTGQPVPAYGLISIITSISLIGLFYVFRKKNKN